MSELRDLYQQVILDHNKSPRNFGPLAAATHKADGYNPLCGDKLTVFLEVSGEVVKNATFVGQGCAISTASASLMTESVKGRTVQEAEQLFGRVHELLTEEDSEPAEELGKLAVFAGVREYPMRVKCATLAWHTLKAAIDGAGGGTGSGTASEAASGKGSDGPVSTE